MDSLMNSCVRRQRSTFVKDSAMDCLFGSFFFDDSWDSGDGYLGDEWVARELKTKGWWCVDGSRRNKDFVDDQVFQNILPWEAEDLMWEMAERDMLDLWSAVKKRDRSVQHFRATVGRLELLTTKLKERGIEVDYQGFANGCFLFGSEACFWTWVSTLSETIRKELYRKGKIDMISFYIASLISSSPDLDIDEMLITVRSWCINREMSKIDRRIFKARKKIVKTILEVFNLQVEYYEKEFLTLFRSDASYCTWLSFKSIEYLSSANIDTTSLTLAMSFVEFTKFEDILEAVREALWPSGDGSIEEDDDEPSFGNGDLLEEGNEGNSFGGIVCIPIGMANDDGNTIQTVQNVFATSVGSNDSSGEGRMACIDIGTPKFEECEANSKFLQSTAEDLRNLTSTSLLDKEMALQETSLDELNEMTEEEGGIFIESIRKTEADRLITGSHGGRAVDDDKEGLQRANGSPIGDIANGMDRGDRADDVADVMASKEYMWTMVHIDMGLDKGMTLEKTSKDKVREMPEEKWGVLIESMWKGSMKIINGDNKGKSGCHGSRASDNDDDDDEVRLDTANLAAYVNMVTEFGKSDGARDVESGVALKESMCVSGFFVDARDSIKGVGRCLHIPLTCGLGRQYVAQREKMTPSFVGPLLRWLKEGWNPTDWAFYKPSRLRDPGVRTMAGVNLILGHVWDPGDHAVK